MSTTFSGLASGVDTDKIVKDIMAVERAPIDRITTKKTEAKQRFDAFGQFKAKLDALKTAVGNMSLTSQIRSTKVSVPADAPFTATSTSGATSSYDISVIQLSQVQKTITNGLASNTESILGTGTIKVNGKTISVNEDNNSLAGLAQSINAAAETTGVRATIINDGTKDAPYHLVFTGKDSSTSFTIESALVDDTAQVIDLGVNDGAGDVQDAQKAVAIIDGITVFSDTNTISTAISGVTLNLNAVDATTSSGTKEDGKDSWEWAKPPTYNSTKMSIEADTGALKEKVTTFVTAYNDAMNWILSGYEEFGGSSTVPTVADGSTEPAILGSVLRGDPTINSMKRQLQNVLTASIKNSGSLKIMSEIGITTNLNGTLNQNNSKLDTALSGNFDNMVSLLSGDDTTAGVMKGFNSLLLKMTNGTNGMYASQKKAYDSSVNRFDSQISLMELRMTKREKVLKSQFSAMEKLVSALNTQGDYFKQQMDALTGTTSS